MEDEISNYIKVWVQATISICYCYAIGKFVPRGTLRLLCIIPIVCHFLFLPLNLQSIHLGGFFGFFIAWLANFKLLLFAFGKGPLSGPSISLFQFVAIASFPIKIQDDPSSSQSSQENKDPPDPSSRSRPNGLNAQNPSQKSHKNGEIKEKSPDQKPKKGQKSIFNLAAKGLIVAALLKVYDYSDYMHPKVLLVLYSFHIYFFLEIGLAMVAFFARALMGVELEAQFDEPYLSTSLQDFWGRRWNIMVTRILRPTVYDPVLAKAAGFMGRKWAPIPAVLATFLVSAVMHELIFYYLGRVRPTGEITWFFILHGFCLVVEIALKKTIQGKFRLPCYISGAITVAFVMGTAFWLFFPPLLRCKGDERAFEEYAAVGAFVKNIVGRSCSASSFKCFPRIDIQRLVKE